MTSIDGIILVGIILCLITIGLTGKTKTTSTEDFFLAGRGLRWWQIGFSLFATNFSASAIIGLTGAAYLTGIAIFNYEWIGILAMIFFALVLVNVVRGSNVYTIAEFLERRYDKRIKIFYSAFIIFLIVFIDMAASLYAGGILLSEFFPNLSMQSIIFIIMILAGLYSVIGGLKAISRTDMFQSVILIIGALLIAYFTFQAAGGWNEMVANAPNKSLSLVRKIDDRAVPWTGLIIGIPILCAYFWLTNQNMVQWVFSAKSAKEARRGLLMAGYLKLLILFIIIIPGVAAVQIIPDLAQADSVYPALLIELLPVGVLGFVLAGFVAGLMANTDSTLHAASTIITMDFVRRAKPNLSAQSLIWTGRITSITIILLSAIWAPMIGNFGTLFEYVQGLLSYAVAPFVVVYLGGMFWSRGTAIGAICALVVGFILALLIGILGDGLGLFSIHYLHVPLPVAAASLATFFVVSKMSESKDVDQSLLWSLKVFSRNRLDDMVLEYWVALTLLCITIFIVFIFR